MGAIQLEFSFCAICHTRGNATELYPANFSPDAFNARIFSARRLPDRIHYRIVQCNSCKLIRSDPVAKTEIITGLYKESKFEYTDEIGNLKQCYGSYLSKLAKYSGNKDAILEIGCGNGFFLEEALRQGYSTAKGVEPSTEAKANSDSNIRRHIISDVMRPNLFQLNQFDAVCMFQVLDHMSAPGQVLDECIRIMKPGGLLLCINHNVSSFSSRLLSKYSPIIDIEHTYLYSPATMRRLFADHMFQIKEIGSVLNRYSLLYLTRLIPLPTLIKCFILKILAASGAGRLPLSIPLGNLYLIAQKPMT